MMESLTLSTYLDAVKGQADCWDVIWNKRLQSASDFNMLRTVRIDQLQPGELHTTNRG